MATAEKPAKKDADKKDDKDDKPAKAKGGGLVPVLLTAILAAAAASSSTIFMVKKMMEGQVQQPAKSAKPHDPDAEVDHEGKPLPPGDEAEDEDGKPRPVMYLDLSPAFVVNMADDDSMRFLQIDVQISSYSQKVLDSAKDHMPRIRNALMLLFSQQHIRDLQTREQKEALQQKALTEVKSALKEDGAPSKIAGLYFTSFVMQ